AGNQANNDGNTSGDNIYKTFVVSAPASTTPDFTLSVAPSFRTVVPTGPAVFTVTVTPLAGFTGTVNLSAANLPTGVSAVFIPTSVNITDANSKDVTVSVSTAQNTPIGVHFFDINAQSGATQHSIQAAFSVVSPSSTDLVVTKTASPNPGQVGVPLSYRITSTNTGPAVATNVSVTDTLPAGLTFVSATTSQGSCSGTATVICNLGSLADLGSATI